MEERNMRCANGFKVALRTSAVIMLCIGSLHTAIAATQVEDQAASNEQADEGDEEPENETAKLASETWEAYVNRLVSLGHLLDSEMESWSDGEEVKKEKVFSLQKFRAETRTRTVAVTRMRKENRDGKEVNVPYTENRPTDLRRHDPLYRIKHVHANSACERHRGRRRRVFRLSDIQPASHLSRNSASRRNPLTCQHQEMLLKTQKRKLLKTGSPILPDLSKKNISITGC